VRTLCRLGITPRTLVTSPARFTTVLARERIDDTVRALHQSFGLPDVGTEWAVEAVP
jgi:hypothetical protein